MDKPGHIIIDGSHGEGGGQILRTALTLSAITGRELLIERIRAGRPKPGLAAQHITSVLSAAKLCAAEVSGAVLGSTTLSFQPTVEPQAGTYFFDVAEAREGGSAGAATLVLQTVALAALFADGPCEFRIRGGTHVAWSPPFDYLDHVWRPFLAHIGVALAVELEAYGFYPLGQGQIFARLKGGGSHAGTSLTPIRIVERGPLRAIRGRSIAANLPSHIAQRMADRAHALLTGLAPILDIRAERVRAPSAGAGIFLIAEYENIVCGFNGYGARGKPSEKVAEEAALALLEHDNSKAALDNHLADQALLPLVLCRDPSTFTCPVLTPHLESNAWVIRQFGMADISFEHHEGGHVTVSVEPTWGTATGERGWP